MEVCPISSQQPTREGGREGGMEIQRKREKTSYSLMLHLTFAFLSHWTSHFPWNFSDVVTAGLLLFIKILGFFSKDRKAIWHTFGDALRKYFKSEFYIPLAWPVELNL